jgi:hypothetical protein
MRSYFLKRIVGVVMQRDDADDDSQPSVCVKIQEHLQPAWTGGTAQSGTILYTLTKWAAGVAYTTADSVDYGGIEWKCASNHTSSALRNFFADVASGYWTRTGVPAAYGRQGASSTYNRCLWLEYIYAPNSVRPEADRSAYVLVPGGNLRMDCGDGTFYLAPVIGQVLYQAYGPYGPRGSVSLLGGRIYSTYDQQTIASAATEDIITAAEMAGWKAAIFMARDGASGSVTCYQTALVQIASSSTAAAALNIHNVSTVTANFEFTTASGKLQLKNNNSNSRTAIVNGLRIY